MFDENQNFPMVGDSAASQSEHTLADQLRHAKGGLAETEQSFRDLFDEAQIAHVYEDADSRILRADRAAMTSGIVLEMPATTTVGSCRYGYGPGHWLVRNISAWLSTSRTGFRWSRKRRDSRRRTHTC
jgi:hypothetical protein